METVFIFVIILLALLLMVFILLYFRCNTTKLRPDECYNIGGLYLVRPSTTAQVMTNCGTNQTEICTYQTNSLEEAIAICDANPKCTTFTFDGSQMNIVDQFTTASASNMTNLYRKAINPIRLTSTLT